MSEVVSRVVGLSTDKASANLTLTVDSQSYTLCLGLRGIVTELEAKEGGILLVDKPEVTGEVDWSKLALKLPLGEALPYLTPQRED